MKYDVIIIGSGFGGLACARQLAQAGRSVLVLERQRQPGGCLQSFCRSGLAFDTGFHYVGGLAEGQAMHRLFSQLGLMHLPWHRLDADGFDRVTIGHDTFAFAEGYDHFAHTMTEYFPNQREAISRYVQLLRDMPPAEELGEINAYEYLTGNFTDQLLINVLSGTSLKMELRRESLPLFTFAHGNSSYIQSSWRLRGDGSLIADSFLGDLQQAGGCLICQAEVEELQEHDGKIVAARTTDGEVYEGSTFISDAHPALTLQWVKNSDKLKGLYRRRISSLGNTFGMFIVSLVLKPGRLAYFNHNKFVYRKPNVWNFHEDTEGVGGIMLSCRVPATVQQEQAEQPLQVDIMTPMPWTAVAPWEQTTVGHRGPAYEQFKNHVANQCMELAEQVIPGLSDMVSQRYTSTPLTWRDYTLTPQGSAYGIRKDSRQFMLTMLSPRTPIPNLYLTGQSLMLHGLEGVAKTAIQTCSLILNDKH